MFLAKEISVLTVKLPDDWPFPNVSTDKTRMQASESRASDVTREEIKVVSELLLLLLLTLRRTGAVVVSGIL